MFKQLKEMRKKNVQVRAQLQLNGQLNVDSMSHGNIFSCQNETREEEAGRKENE